MFPTTTLVSLAPWSKFIFYSYLRFASYDIDTPSAFEQPLTTPVLCLTVNMHSITVYSCKPITKMAFIDFNCVRYQT